MTSIARSVGGRWLDRLAGWAPRQLMGPLAIAVAVIALVLSEGGYMTVRMIAAQRDAALEARLTVGNLRRLVLVVESSHRGYMLTERPAYRDPYDENLKALEVSVQEVRDLAGRYESQRDTLLELADVASRKVSQMNTSLRKFDAGEHHAAFELVLTDVGRQQMERIEALVGEVLAREELIFERSARAHDRVMLWSRLGIALLVLLCILAVFTAIRQGREIERERARHLAQLAAERDKLEEEVERRTHELTELARHLQTVREDERSFLARELHDELGGLLTAAKLDLARVKKRLDLGVPELAERFQHLTRALDAVIALKRRIIEDLRPSSLNNLGLQRTLEIQCAEFAQRGELQVLAEIDDVTLVPERALAVYRLVQEALTNVSKYARARQVRVGLRRDGALAQVTVQDDGIGFDPARIGDGAHGLAGMRFRVQSCGGEFVVRSRPGEGTTIVARVPV